MKIEFCRHCYDDSKGLYILRVNILDSRDKYLDCKLGQDAIEFITDLDFNDVEIVN